MANSNSKTRRIINNTLALYIRMAVTMIISLYTSRVVLKELGIDDFGLYQVVGGVVAIFSFLKTSMSSSTQRFLSFEMGKGNADNLRNTFSICLTSHFLIALILLLLTETIGLWFLNVKLNIPEGRMEAANWLYQFSVISLFFHIISIPFTADIISNEKMGYFAFLGIFDSLLKLLIAFLITISPIDKLVFYGFLVLLISVINAGLTWIYCHVKFNESHFRFYWDKDAFKKVFSFSGWTIWGQLAVVGANQGAGILVNLFFSVAANAAIGVGHQVNNALSGLVYNFQSAFKPQITKSYAEGDFNYLNTLIRFASKISFLLLFLVSLPIIANIDFVLGLWLEKVPEGAASLCVIYIIATLFDALSGPLWMSVFATGKIRSYQLAISLFYISELLFIYILFKLGCSLAVGISMKAVLNFSVIFLRTYFAKRQVVYFDAKGYLCRTVAPLFSIGAICFLLSLCVNNMCQTIMSKIAFTIALEVLAFVLSYLLALNKSERASSRKLILSKIK